MFPAQVRFWLIVTSRDDITTYNYRDIEDFGGRSPQREGESGKYFVSFKGDHILDMPDKFIPESFLKWAENNNLFNEVSIMSTEGFYGRTNGLRCIGNVRISVSSGKVLATGPDFKEVLEALQRFVHEKLEPGTYDRNFLTNEELAGLLMSRRDPNKRKGMYVVYV